MIMKKLTTYLSILASILLFLSCSNEEQNNENNELLLKSSSEGLIIIDSEETPTLNYESRNSLGFNQIKYDTSRNTTLSIDSNVLKVPVDFNESETNENFDQRGLICIKILIARLNPNGSGSCSGGCIECLGFRCSEVSIPCNQQQMRSNPSDREQFAYISYNEGDNYIEYHFINDINWDYLASN
mgnify:CR=1 FL=1|tara:strand:+ start:290651 stop:291205 length:555 start_codon:yes stop_codon:yes gene_type:complete